MERKQYRKKIHFTYKEAEQLTSIRHSCVVEVPHEMSLVMPHKFVSNIRLGLKEELDKLLLVYNRQLKGIPLAFNNIKVVSSKIVCDLEVFTLDIKLSFIVFRPEPGKLLNGIVNKITGDRFGCIIHRCINGSVRQPDRSVLNSEQKDIVDNIKSDDMITFKIWKFDVHHGIIIVLGDILPECYQHIPLNSQSCSVSDSTKPIDTIKRELPCDYKDFLQDNGVQKSPNKLRLKVLPSTDTSQQGSHIVVKTKRKKKDSTPVSINSDSSEINRTTDTSMSPERNGTGVEVKKEVLSEDDLF